MRALALTDVQRFQLIDIALPSIQPNSVLIRVAAVGLCGTDLHIYKGDANYNLNSSFCPIPLSDSPQILGHEISGYVEGVGADVRRCQMGDLVIVDQVLSCVSQQRTDLCEYCETGDAHQCEFAQELGITGPPGGFADFIAVPETNVVKVPKQTTALQGAIAEPLACIVHAQERSDRAATRYSWESKHRIRHVAILGAGPSGLLFLQFLRNVKRFDGEIFVIDRREAKLGLARQLGATALDSRQVDIGALIHRHTQSEGIHYLIEATGSGTALGFIPKLVRKQATLLLYGAGHANLTSGCLTPWQAMELAVVSSAGASGKLSPQNGPEIYTRALQLISEGTINVECLATHRYNSLDQVPQAFSFDWHQDKFIKAVLLPQ